MNHKTTSGDTMTSNKRTVQRNVFFLVFNLLALVLYYTPMRDLFIASQDNELYSHIILIPLVSGYFIYLQRKALFSDTRYAFTPGIILIMLGGTLYLLGMTQEPRLNQNDYLSLMTFSAVVFWGGGFVLFFGIQAARKAAFPLLFLVFMIPIPTVIVDKIIFLLQSASAEATYGVFKLTGVPIFREGFVFHLPGISIEVAKQCSGIRSTLALLITSVLAGHLFLQTKWRRAALIVSIFPITIFKNGLRIVTLSLLGAYVDETILTDSVFHRNAGIPFFILALVLLAPVLWFLKRSEKRKGCRKQEIRV